MGRMGAFTKSGTILADPAWPYRLPRANVGTAGRGNQNGRAGDIIQVDASAHYPLMPLEETKGLPVKEVAADAAHLYIWTSWSRRNALTLTWSFSPVVERARTSGAGARC